MMLFMFWMACTSPKPAGPASAHEVVVVERGGSLGEALPTVVALHGLGDTPEDFARSLERFPGKVRVVSVGGLEPWPNGGHAWWTTRMASEDWDALAADIGSASDAIAPLLARLDADPSVCGKPVVTGFSQGGMLSFALASREQEHVAAALPIGGMVFPGVAQGPYVTTVALHGEDDLRVSYANTQRAVGELEAAGEDVVLQSFPGVGHSISPLMRETWYRELRRLLPTCDAPGGE